MKTYFILFVSTFLFVSCDFSGISSNTKRITEMEARDIMNREVGNQNPGPNLYPFYVETYTVLEDYRYDFEFLIQIDRIFGNEVEGVIARYDGRDEIIMPFFGRYNRHLLYIYTGGSRRGNINNKNLFPQELYSERIMVFNVSPDRKYLTRASYAWSMIEGVVQWFPEPPYNVNVSDSSYRTLIFNSTGFYFSQQRPQLLLEIPDPKNDSGTNTRGETEIIEGGSGRGDGGGVRNNNEQEDPRGNSGVRTTRD